MIDEAHIARLLTEGGSLPEAGQALVSAANAAGGRDNITVVLFRVEEIERAGAAAVREQDTTAGQAAPRANDVRAAVAMAEREATATRATPRSPRPRAVPRTATRSRRRLGGTARVAIALAVIVAFVGAGLYLASQAVYFVGTNDGAHVAVFQGLPYKLPLGVNLYTTNYVSGVSAGQVPTARRTALFDHTLRSQSDAYDLVRRLERGELR